MGVRPHTREDLGRAGTGRRGSGEGRSGGRGGVGGGEGRHLQDSALFLEAGPGLLHPPCALTRGEPWLDGVGGTRPSPPSCTCPASRTPQTGPPETPALPHLPQGLRLHGVLGLHQLQLFLPENPGRVRRQALRERAALDPALPPRPPSPKAPPTPEHLQGRQLGPELLLRPLLAQLLSSVVEELGVGLVRAGREGMLGVGTILGGGAGRGGVGRGRGLGRGSPGGSGRQRPSPEGTWLDSSSHCSCSCRFCCSWTGSRGRSRPLRGPRPSVGPAPAAGSAPSQVPPSPLPPPTEVPPPPTHSQAPPRNRPRPTRAPPHSVSLPSTAPPTRRSRLA